MAQSYTQRRYFAHAEQRGREDAAPSARTPPPDMMLALVSLYAACIITYAVYFATCSSRVTLAAARALARSSITRAALIRTFA